MVLHSLYVERSRRGVLVIVLLLPWRLLRCRRNLPERVGRTIGDRRAGIPLIADGDDSLRSKKSENNGNKHPEWGIEPAKQRYHLLCHVRMV